MEQNASTYALVLASTYPQLKIALEKVMGQPLNSDSFLKFKKSLIHQIIMCDLELIVHIHSLNYNNINVCLNRIDVIIDHISNINYIHLTDKNKARLPSLAKEVDQANYHIREEVFLELIAEKSKLHTDLTQQIERSVAYIKNLDVIMNTKLKGINETFGLEIAFTEGKTIWNWNHLRHWVDRNQQIDEKIKTSVLKMEDGRKLEPLLKAVLIMEVMVSLFPNGVIAKSDEQKKALKILKNIQSLSLTGVEFERLVASEGSKVEDMNITAKLVESLHEEVSLLPLNIDEEDLKADLNSKIKMSTIFTTVDNPVMD
jgi:hypothetical protein